MALTRRALLAGAAALPLSARATTPPQDWLAEGEANGVPNLWHVHAGLWRSAQPRAEGFRFLADIGIRTVISLRQTVDDARRSDEPRLTLIRVPMKSRAVGEDDGARIQAALAALQAGLGRGPVLVHCRHGADRTGCVVALYRMLWQGWPRAKAIAEMTGGPYGFHPVWQNIPDYLDTADLDALRAALPGLPAPG